MKIINAVQDAIMFARLPQSSFTAACAAPSEGDGMSATNTLNRCGFMPKMHSRPRSFGFGGSFLKTAHAGVKAHLIRNWSTVLQYRRKARTITVDGVEPPAPETEALRQYKDLLYKPVQSQRCGELLERRRTDTSTYLKTPPPGIGTTLSNGLDFIVSTMTRGP